MHCLGPVLPGGVCGIEMAGKLLSQSYMKVEGRCQTEKVWLTGLRTQSGVFASQRLTDWQGESLALSGPSLAGGRLRV